MCVSVENGKNCRFFWKTFYLTISKPILFLMNNKHSDCGYLSGGRTTRYGKGNACRLNKTDYLRTPFPADSCKRCKWVQQGWTGKVHGLVPWCSPDEQRRACRSHDSHRREYREQQGNHAGWSRSALHWPFEPFLIEKFMLLLWKELYVAKTTIPWSGF